MSHTECVHIVFTTTNDRNGNSRRLSVLLSAKLNTAVAVEEHYYNGPPKSWPTVALTQAIAPSEYREWVKIGEDIKRVANDPDTARLLAELEA